MTTNWVGVASREHVAAAVEDGFCQLNHGKEALLKRIRPGDRIVYYPPRERMRAGAVVQAFVALGTILPREPYRGGMFEINPSSCTSRRSHACKPALRTLRSSARPTLRCAGR